MNHGTFRNLQMDPNFKHSNDYTHVSKPMLLSFHDGRSVNIHARMAQWSESKMGDDRASKAGETSALISPTSMNSIAFDTIPRYICS